MAALRSFDFRSIFKLNWISLVGFATSNPSYLPSNDPPLTDDQYKALITHLNRYVDSLVTQKISTSSQTLSPTILQNIANTVNEHISKQEYVFGAADVDRIADIVRAQLLVEKATAKANAPTSVLSIENVEQFTRLIKERIQTENIQAAATVDLDLILGQIISSPKLKDVIDHRVVVQTRAETLLIPEQKHLIDVLRNEIEAIKLKLDTNTDAQQHVQQTLILLKKHQDNIDNSFMIFKRENEDRLADLLRDVDLKISNEGSRHFASIEARIKVMLMDILGYKTEDNATPDIVDLKSWIQNVFVAKNLLEERLQVIREQNDIRLAEEIDRSAGILMANIGERIREQTIILIERNNNEIFGTEHGNGTKYRSIHDLDEHAIRNIVKEALAVYDADKTGLVDYALESAGGEIVSTR